jgi:hypothetical protein
MTGPNTTATAPDSVAGGAGEAHEVAETAAFLAAEAVANDYHAGSAADDVVD